MTDIFISYARSDLEMVRPLAEALENAGLSVFWDQTIPTGLTWDSYVHKELVAAKCIVVAWTASSVNSEWVREEAGVGKSKNNLFPVLLDKVNPPFGFGSIQAMNLSDWNGDTEALRFKRLLIDMERHIQFPVAANPTIETNSADPKLLNIETRGKGSGGGLGQPVSPKTGTGHLGIDASAGKSHHNPSRKLFMPAMLLSTLVAISLVGWYVWLAVVTEARLWQLTINTVPADATVVLPDIAAEYAPEMELPGGTYLVEVSAPYFQTRTQTINLAEGNLVTTVRLQPSHYRLTVIPDPDNAEVRLVGTSTPLDRDGIYLPPGSYQVEISAAGFETRHEGFTLLDTNINMTISLEASFPLPTMVVIPAGSFQMGSNEGEMHEKPVHTVDISSFSIMTREMTKADFAEFIQDSGYQTDAEKNSNGDSGCHSYHGGEIFDWQAGTSWRNPGFTQQADEPAVCISFNDAQTYIKWLNNKTESRFRLPTEAEWEYVTRAGSSARYSFGDAETLLCEFGNVADRTAQTHFTNWNTANCDDNNIYTAAVGSYKANAFGLHDLHGNVWEWVQDCFEDSYQFAPADGSASESVNCATRVLRGGGWGNMPINFRSSARRSSPPSGRGSDFGFRLAHDL